MTDTQDPLTTTDDPSPVFFMHLMKTAGASLHFQVAEAMPSGWTSRELGDHVLGGFYHYLSPRSWLQMPTPLRGPIRFYSGHVPAVAAELIPRPPVTVTLLRHPVHRTVSWLRHAQRGHPEHRGKSLEEIYDDEWWNERFIANHQVKMLSMTLDEALTPAWSDVLEPAEGEWLEQVLTPGHVFTDEEAGRLFHLFPGTTARRLFEVFGPNTHRVRASQDRLRRALDLVDGMDVVGITSQLARFVAAARDRLGWDISASPRVNSAGMIVEPVSTAFRRRIAADNVYDMALFSYVRNRLETEAFTAAPPVPPPAAPSRFRRAFQRKVPMLSV